MIGAGTLVVDDPLLTVRHANWPAKKVLRAVLDPSLRFPAASRLLTTLDRGRIVVFAGREAPAEKAGALRALGVEVLLAPDRAKAWSLEGVLAELGRLEISALLVEGGSRLFTSFVEGGLADKAVLTFAPLLVGGAAAPGFFGGAGAAAVAGAVRLKRTREFSNGSDIIVEGYF
jgi:diaminohydroxyphosphoribosylaminopyrimidine deaminase/5-amino-6-(5-phosphoribosylamino)uracil reductase